MAKPNAAAARRAALAAWWARGPWPCVLLCIDPGASAGASLAVCGPWGMTLLWSVQVDTFVRGSVEGVIAVADAEARARDLPLVAMLEDWGAGGPRGLAQWIGLGEARGIWKRWLLILANESPTLIPGRIVKAPQSRWRGRVIEATGVPDGKIDKKTGLPVWRPFKPEEWKRQARQTAVEYFLNVDIPIQEDAAESACMLIYGARSDEVMKALGKRYLKKSGIPDHLLEPLEPVIRSKKKKKAKSTPG